MKRVTLDANVLAPGFTSERSASARIIGFWQRKVFELVVFDHLLAELAHALADPYFAARMSPDEADFVVARLGIVAMVVPLTSVVQGVATHPEDDLVLSTALSGQADYLCTRDKQLLRLRSYQTVIILSPGELLARLDAGEFQESGS